MIIPGWSIVLGALIIYAAVKVAFRGATGRNAGDDLLIGTQHDELIRKDQEIWNLQRQLNAERIDRNAQVTKLNKLWVSYCALETKLNTKEAEWLHAYKGGSQFSQEDIKALIRLCHPDKHNGSEAATRLTGKLLEMRK